MMSALDQHDFLYYGANPLTQQSTCRHVTLRGRIILIPSYLIFVYAH